MATNASTAAKTADTPAPTATDAPREVLSDADRKATAGLDKALNIDPIAVGLVTQAALDNYDRIIQRDAATNGTSVKEAKDAKVKWFVAQHENDGLGGWDHLAHIYANRDVPETDAVADALAARRARVIESEKREPTAATILGDLGDAELVSKAVIHARTSGEMADGAAAAGEAPVPTEDERKASEEREAALNKGIYGDTADSAAPIAGSGGK